MIGKHRDRPGLALRVALCLAGCSNMQMIGGGEGTVWAARIEVGERIRVLDRDGLSTDLEVTLVGADHIALGNAVLVPSPDL